MLRLQSIIDRELQGFSDLSGRAEIIRQFPLIPGIDLSGTVEALSHPGIAVGDRDLDLKKLSRTTRIAGLAEVPNVGRAPSPTVNLDFPPALEG